MFKRVMSATGLSILVLMAFNFADGAINGSHSLSNVFFRAQDLPILGAMTMLAAFSLSRAPGRDAGPTALLSRWSAGPLMRRVLEPDRSLVWVIALAAACGVVAWIGTGLVFHAYPLSMDEFMADFDASIIARGHLLAAVAPAWQADLPALGPQFLFHPEGGAYWVSSYLPVNAALRALGNQIGARSLVSPLLAVTAIIAVFGVGRRLWPDRPQIAWFAAIMLATSSQFLITAMTPYAMTAHLAFNLVWLWLFLIDRRWSHLSAIVVGALACGLHQLIFHPLFVAPFIGQLWLDRRWRLAAVYTLAYAAIGLFWLDYTSFALKTVAAVVGRSTDANPQGGTAWVVVQIHALLGNFKPAAIGILAKNLIRFITWQNLIVCPLLVIGAVAAVRAKGMPRALILGLALTLVAALSLMAYQGHGWGYRYIHGLLGSACLLAAWTWASMAERADAADRGAAGTMFLMFTLVSALVLFPVRAWQAHAFARPYAAAGAEIQRAKTPIVIVDDAGIWFGVDFVRNGPFLDHRPLVLYRGLVGEPRLRELCARYAVTLFDRRDAERLGVPTFAEPSARPPLDFGRRLADLKCQVTRSGP